MRYLLILLLSSQSLAADFSGTLKFELAPWTASCDADQCGLPTASAPAIALSINVPRTSGAGSANIASESASWAETSARITLISIEPHSDSPHPPYIQIKLEVTSGDATTVCAQSVRWKLPFESPPLICGTRIGAKQTGVTTASSWTE
jgi:hypothetical protein